MTVNWFKRMLSLALAVLMLGGVFVLTGCDLGDRVPMEPTDSSLLADSTTEDSKEKNEENKEENKEENNKENNKPIESAMPNDGVGMQDFGGREIRLLGFNAASANEFEVDAEDTGTTLKAAVYARNQALENRLNVKLKWDYVNGHAGYEPDYVKEAGQRASRGEVDIFTPYSQAGSWLMMNGLTQDLNNAQYLDLSDSWWNQTSIENCKVNGKNYFAAGDISWTLMGNAIGFCYNKDILEQNSKVLEQFGVTSMYDLVQQKKWTLDNFITISKSIDLTKSYGFTSYIVPMDAFYKACDLNWMEVNAKGEQEISNDQGSGRVNEALQKLSTFFRTEAAAVRLAYDMNLNYATNNGNKSNPSNPEWMMGQSLFVLNPMLSITDFKFHELGFDFGVLPMPLYESNQGSYKTVPDFEYSIVAIPRQVHGELLNQVGAVLQVMASEGQSRIAPAYYKEVMKKQPTDDIKEYTLWETIKDSVELDGGRMFSGIGGREYDGVMWVAFRRSLQLQKNAINEQWDGQKGMSQQLVANMNTSMANIEAKYQ